MRLPIIPVAVAPDQLHIFNKGLRLGIAVVKQALLDCPEVHWTRYYGEIVKDVELYRVYWL